MLSTKSFSSACLRVLTKVGSLSLPHFTAGGTKRQQEAAFLPKVIKLIYDTAEQGIHIPQTTSSVLGLSYDITVTTQSEPYDLTAGLATSPYGPDSTSLLTCKELNTKGPIQSPGKSKGVFPLTVVHFRQGSSCTTRRFGGLVPRREV